MSMTTFSESERRADGIDPATALGVVRLTVSDLDRSRAFYEQAIGLKAVEREDGTIALGPENGPALVELLGDPSAPALNPRATGLFHLAILQPSRRDLALALARLAAARRTLSGASDHLVSEALYLSDPDGNGIEIYRDRPRSEWRQDENGQLAMATIPLDLDDVMSAAAGATEIPSLSTEGTTMGHVHLQVSNLDDAEAFYSGILGFDVMVRGYPGALFVAAGGYHHHIGLNTWNSAGAAAPPRGSVGLRSFEVVLPDQAALNQVLDRVDSAGLPLEQTGPADTVLVRDPSGNGVLLRASA
jgi:catechol 2,3-dioxygenase